MVSIKINKKKIGVSNKTTVANDTRIMDLQKNQKNSEHSENSPNMFNRLG